MSREIDLTKPLSDEDREYLLQRNRLHDIEVADAVAAGAEPEDVKPPLPPATFGVPHSVDQTPQAEPASALGQERDREGALEPERQAEASLVNEPVNEDATLGTSADPSVSPADTAPEGDQKVATEGDVTADNTKEPEVQSPLVEETKTEEDSDAAEVSEGEGEGEDNYDDKDAWSFDDLRDEARKRDLATGGNRAEIVSRLRADDSKES